MSAVKAMVELGKILDEPEVVSYFFEEFELLSEGGQ